MPLHHIPPSVIGVDTGHNILSPKRKLSLWASGGEIKEAAPLSGNLRHRLVKKAREYLLVLKGRTRIRSKSGEELAVRHVLWDCRR